MKTILLAGGYGTRLFPLTLRTPKPLLPVAGKPIIQYTLELLREAAMGEIVVSLKENQKKIERCIGNGSKFGVKISYIYEPETTEEGKLGSVGAINYVLSKINAKGDVLVIGGDNFIVGLNVREFTGSHSKAGAHASIALFNLRSQEDARHFGVARLDGGGRIIEFQEKPQPEKAVSKLASTAVYALNKAFVTEHLPSYAEHKHSRGEKADKIGDLWIHFVSDLKIAGHPFEGIWGDIGNCRDYLETNRLAFDHQSMQRNGFSGTISKVAKIAKNAEIIHPVIIEDDCEISDGAKIGPYAHIMHHTAIGRNATVANAIVFERCRVGEGCKVENSILDGRAEVSSGCTIGEYSMVGFGCKIHENSKLTSAKVYPGMRVQRSSDIKGELANSTTPSSREMQESCYWE